MVELDVRREAASDLGLSVPQIAASLRTLIAGQTYDVNVRLAPDARSAVGSNADGSARIVRLSQVAGVRESTGPNQINRRNLTREVAISANVYQRSAGEVSSDIKAALASVNFPPGYRYAFSGSTKNMAESFGYAVSALVMTILFISEIPEKPRHSCRGGRGRAQSARAVGFAFLNPLNAYTVRE